MYSSIAVRALLLATVLLLASCAALRPEGDARLPGGGWWQPLSPALLGRDFTAVQRVDGNFGGRGVVFVFYLEVEGDSLALVATTPDGSTLFSLSQMGATVTIEPSPLLPRQWQPAAVLMDLQLAFWPTAAVAANLPRGTTLGVGATGERSLRRDAETLTTIRYEAADPWAAPLLLQHHRLGYGYIVTPLSLTEADRPASRNPQ